MYPNAAEATEALTSFLKHYLPEAGSKGFALLENAKWCAAAVKGKVLAIVLEADSQRLAKGILEGVTQAPSQK